jgi:putative Ca2+/H+ antiporter (TMEM165/GDT1 family)
MPPPRQTRFRAPLQVMLGILTATVLNHGLASTAGVWVSGRVSASWLAAILALTFFTFGLWTLRPDTLDDGARPSRYGAYVTTTLLFFFAEMGDKTQLATVALAARFQAVLSVTIGTTLGMLFSDGLAVALGDRLAVHVQGRLVRGLAAALFFAFGAVCAVSAWRMADARERRSSGAIAPPQ